LLPLLFLDRHNLLPQGFGGKRATRAALWAKLYWLPNNANNSSNPALMLPAQKPSCWSRGQNP